MKFYGLAKSNRVSVISEYHACILQDSFEHYEKQNRFGLDDAELGKVELMASENGARVFDLPKSMLDQLIKAGGHTLVVCPDKAWRIHLERCFTFGLHTGDVAQVLKAFGVKFAKAS
ncbi:MAG: hypothetical protein WC641_07675 [Patescibacteria group bacterium]